MKFFGKVGFGASVKMAPGVWDEGIIEREYYGDVVRNVRDLVADDKVNFDLTTTNSISIVADAYITEHFHAIRYVEWSGARWIVDNVDASTRPRLLLRLGGVYNGPAATTPQDP